jgi:hypothetical protein
MSSLGVNLKTVYEKADQDYKGSFESFHGGLKLVFTN